MLTCEDCVHYTGTADDKPPWDECELMGITENAYTCAGFDLAERLTPSQARRVAIQTEGRDGKTI